MLSAKENQKGRTLKHGYLLKQSEVLKQWHLRYFVLSKECLCYYRTEKESLESAPKEVIYFNDMSLYIDELPDKQTKYCLKLVKRSLSSKITTRTFFLCCFSEHERNEWLSQILQAKAIALVVNPGTWMRNQEASAKDVDFKLVNSGSSVRLTSAKEIFQKCRRKISSGGHGSTRDSTNSLFLDDFNVNKRRKSTSCLSQEWRNTLMAI
ncbi:RAC family serine/threonine-protein kinase homolog [Orbicella faveolata]|uniref:RAC family serine/threonine-protein kinase homolog n=1 Tax=Orbicella faveolata TaxID=48498 RepID=UPI0009E2CED2|nr:RAC family serine/threonine-protein kinase homolog [Orbicella faveolata]